MAVPAVIRPLGALRKLGERKSGADKWGLQIDVPDIEFRVDETKIALHAALGIQNTLRENLGSGKQPDGIPMPRVSDATVKRRAYRRQQMIGGALQLALTRKQLGEALPGLANNTRAAERARRDRRALRRRFKAAAVKGPGPQGVFLPKDPSTFGLESGLMAASVRVLVSPPGFKVFFADKRGSFAELNPGRGYMETAVHRVFSRIQIWNDRAMKQPIMVSAMKGILKAIVARRLNRAFAELVEAVENVQEIAATASESDQ